MAADKVPKIGQHRRAENAVESTQPPYLLISGLGLYEFGRLLPKRQFELESYLFQSSCPQRDRPD